MNRLGVDIGGVIIDRANDQTDTSFFGDNYLSTTATPGVFEALRDIRDQVFGDNIWLVSKCRYKTQERTLRWLAHNDLYDRTGIIPENVRFTTTRIGKVAIALDLGLTHFVDDRLDVLGYMKDKVSNLYLFNPDMGIVEGHEEQLDDVIVVPNWETLQQLLTD